MENNNDFEQDSALIITPELGFEAEAYLLSLLLNNHPEMDLVFSKLNNTDFQNEHHRYVYSVINQLHKSLKQINPVVVIENLISQKLLSQKEAEQLVTYLSTYNGNSDSLISYVNLIRMVRILKKLNNFGEDLCNISVDFVNFEDKLIQLEQQFLEIVKNDIDGSVYPISDVVNVYMDKFKKSLSEQVITGTKTGYAKIDKLTNGFQPGDLIVLAARPGRGKTAFAINLMLNVAKNLLDNEVVVMFSLEMGAEQIIHRMVAAESMINFNLGNVKFMPSEDTDNVMYGLNEIKELPIYIDDSSNISLSEIQGRLKQIAATKTLKLVVIDYLQLIKVTRTYVGMNRQQEVTLISHNLKALARELKVPILAIAQLSRKIEERRGPDSQPILSDLRESGSIEQDADLVCFLHTVSEDTNDENSEISTNADIEFIISKHRNGATGKANLTFLKSIGKFIPKENSYSNPKE